MNTVFGFALLGFGLNLLSLIAGMLTLQRLQAQAHHNSRLSWDLVGMGVLLMINSWFVLMMGYTLTLNPGRPY